jgi:hypothetical protein
MLPMKEPEGFRPPLDLPRVRSLVESIRLQLIERGFVAKAEKQDETNGETKRDSSSAL